MLTEGQTFEVPYPFSRDTYESWDEDGPVKAKTWRPGVRYEHVPPDDSEAVADGMGKQILQIVSIHKPGRYPARVFYTRQWESPVVRRFGKPRLHIATTQKFRRLIAGYRHGYRLLTEVAA